MRAIEGVYKEHCEKNSKEQPKYLDSSGADELVWTDSTVWEKVRTLVINLHLVVLSTYSHEKVNVGYRTVSSHLKMEEFDSLESLTEENGVRKQINVFRKKRKVKDRKETLCASYMSLYCSNLATEDINVPFVLAFSCAGFSLWRFVVL